MRAAVLGSPIGHSLSPVLHRAAYAALGLTDWSYDAIECDEAGLPALLDSLGPGWAGLSLTMPLKRAVLPLLDEADGLVGEVGAANTVVLARGSRSGFNTDVPGMAAALAEAGARPAEPVLILGGGATACSAVAALHGAGVSTATVAVRNPTAAEQVLAVAERVGLQADLVSFGPGRDRDAWLAAWPGRPWSLLLSTVPGQAADEYADLLAGGKLVTRAVFDVVYYPWPTRLAQAAQSTGVPVIGGFELLVHQAARQVTLMTGRPAPVEAMRAAGLAALAARGS
jgi:shikimate dehydrogenase